MTCPTHSALQLQSHNLVMNSPVLKSFVYLLSFEPWIERISIFMVSRSKFLRAGGLAKLSVLTQLIGSGFVENSRLVFFLCCFHLPPCDQDCSMVWLQCVPVGAQDFLFADTCFSQCQTFGGPSFSCVYFCCCVVTKTQSQVSCLVKLLALISVLSTKYISQFIGHYCYSVGSDNFGKHFMSECHIPVFHGNGLCPKLLVKNFRDVWMCCQPQ